MVNILVVSQYNISHISMFAHKQQGISVDIWFSSLLLIVYNYKITVEYTIRSNVYETCTVQYTKILSIIHNSAKY